MNQLLSDLQRALWPISQPLASIPIRGIRSKAPPSDPISAAVLLPIIIRRRTPMVLFTLRSTDLNAHAGQVSFPGGRVEASDSDAVAAALRETHEETGINPAQVKPLGLLDYVDTITHYRVMPVVGMVDETAVITPDQREVAEVFELPLAELLKAEHYQRQSVSHDGQRRSFYSYRYSDHTIWGVTAGILMNLVERLDLAALQPGS